METLEYNFPPSCKYAVVLASDCVGSRNYSVHVSEKAAWAKSLKLSDLGLEHRIIDMFAVEYIRGYNDFTLEQDFSDYPF